VASETFLVAYHVERSSAAMYASPIEFLSEVRCGPVLGVRYWRAPIGQSFPVPAIVSAG
jgi:hypothetical protein